jgi:3-oxoacyl-[acyl-carrier protein] reductase
VTTPTGPVALVSGGSRGIGRACAWRLARDGHRVAICYQSNDRAAKELESQAADAGLEIIARKADVTDSVAVRALVSEVEELLGPIEVAVTAAGITRDRPLVMMADAEWSDVVRTNLDGVFHLCRAVVFSMMKARRGSIVNLSSVAGVYGNPGQTNYSASKAGIIGFTRSLAKEVGRYGIRANVVAPGFIDTDMTTGLTDAARAKMLKSIPLGRMGQADEVAELVSYLAGDRAGYVTGSVLQIDGGITV